MVADITNGWGTHILTPSTCYPFLTIGQNKSLLLHLNGCYGNMLLAIASPPISLSSLPIKLDHGLSPPILGIGTGQPKDDCIYKCIAYLWHVRIPQLQTQSDGQWFKILRYCSFTWSCTTHNWQLLNQPVVVSCSLALTIFKNGIKQEILYCYPARSSMGI